MTSIFKGDEDPKRWQQVFEQEGYFVVKNLFSKQEVESIKNELSRLTKLWPNNLPKDAKPMVDMDPTLLNEDHATMDHEQLELKVRRYFRMAVHDKYFAELAKHPKMVHFTKAIIGDNVKLIQSMALCKPPGSGAKRWHQDNAYFRLDPSKVLAFWVALEDTNVDNGCMHVVPKSHHAGIVPHAIPKDIKIPQGQEHAFFSLPQTPDPSQVVAIPLEEGDALVFHGELFHFTPPNKTTKRRRAIQYHYAASECVPKGSSEYWYYRKSEMLICGKDFGEGYI